MFSPLDSLLTRLLRRRSAFAATRARSILTPHQIAARRPLASSQLTLATAESLEPRQLMAVTPSLNSSVLFIDMNASGDTAFVRELAGTIVVANSATNLGAAPLFSTAVSNVTEIRVQDIANVTGEQFTVFTSTGLTRFLNVPSGGNLVDSVTINAPVSNRTSITANTLSLGASIAAGTSNLDLMVLGGSFTATTALSGKNITLAAPNGSLTLQQQVTGTAAVSLTAQNNIQTVASLSSAGLTINSTNGSVSLGGTTTATGTASVSASQGSITVAAAFSAGVNPVTFTAQNDITSTASITSGALCLTSSNGNVSLGGTTTATGGLTAQAQNSVTISGATTVTGGNATLTATTGGVSVAAALTATPNDVSITAKNGSITVSSAGSIAGGNVTLQTTEGPIQADGNISADLTTGLLTIDGPSNASNPGATLGSTGTLSAQCLAIYMFSNRTSTNAAAFTSLVTNVSNILGFVNTPLRIRNGSAANLTVGSVLSAEGSIDIQSGGNILVPSNLAVTNNSSLTLNSTGGSIRLNASLLVSNAPVVLSANANVSGSGLINVASGSNASLDITAGRSGGAGTISVTTRTDSVSARVNGIGDLTINEFDGLTVAAGNVTTTNGSITITASCLAAGNLTGTGSITAGGASSNVTLRNTGGNVTFSNTNQVTASNQLNVTSQNAVNLGTNVANLTARISNPGDTLTVSEANGLGISGPVTTTNGAINITAGRFSAGNVTGSGLVSAGTANVTITNNNGGVTLNAVSGQISANVLNVTAKNSVAISTNVNNVGVTVSGALQSANVQQLVQLNNLAITTNAGDITINLAAGNLLSSSAITASNGSASGNVTLGAVAGNIAVGPITGNILSVTALNASSFNTTVNQLAANITGSGQNLTVTETDGLAINTSGVRTNNAAIFITAGNSNVGSLNGTGSINAGTGDVTLFNANGSITLSGTNQVVANLLTVTGRDSVNLGTSVGSINASAGRIGGGNATATLTVSESTGLGIVGAVSNGGQIAITSGLSGASNITGSGSINATTSGNVTLTNANGGVTLTAANQVIGNVLTISARDSVAVNTSVGFINASTGKIGGGNATATLTVNEATGLGILGAVSNGGQIAITSGLFGASNVNGTGSINATSAGDVTLTNANGGITLTAANQITGNILTISATDSVAVNTSVGSINASVGTAGNTAATLTVTESTGLGILGAVSNGGQIAITSGLFGASNITGNGSINATSSGNVSLTNSRGGITLTAANQVTAGVLTISARDSVALNTSVGSINASVGSGNTAATLTVNESTGLGILGAVSTGGQISITSGLFGASNLNGTGPINATSSGNVTLTNANGGIALTGNLTGNQVTASVLTVSAKDSVAVNTSVGSIHASAGMIGGGNAAATLTINEATGLGILGAASNGGLIAITSGLSGASTLTGTGSINAAPSGNVTLTNANGAITLNAPGQVVGNVLNVTAQSSVAIDASVNNLVANITGNGSLNLVNAGNLAIDTGTAVTTANGAIAISAANLVLDGSLTAGPTTGTPSNVTLTVTGLITGAGTLTASNLVWTSANQASDAIWIYDSLNATVTGAGNGINITRSSSSDLNIVGLTTLQGPINVALTGQGGNLLLNGPVTAGNQGLLDNVTISAANGGVVGTGLITGNILDITARDSSSLSTNVDFLVANISATAENLTVIEQNTLNIAAGTNVTVNNVIDITVLNGDLDLSGAVNSRSLANVTLSVPSGSITGTGNISAGNLNWTAVAQQSSLVSANWTYSGLTANVTGAGNDLTILSNGINGTLSIYGLSTHSGTINITPQNTSVLTAVDLLGNVSAGYNQPGVNNVVIGLGNGAITSNGGTISGNVLNLTASNGADLVTDVAALAANVTSGNLAIQNAFDLVIDAANVTNPTGNVSLFAGGDITSVGTITASNLDIAANSAVVITAVGNLTGSVTGSGGVGLDVSQTGSLAIAAGNVTSNGDNIAINVSSGSLTGNGSILANGGDIVLTAGQGSITLNTSAAQIVGENLTVVAQNAVQVNTCVTGLAANLSDPLTGNLTVADSDHLTILAAGVTTQGGDINLTSQTGAINGSGVVDATGGNLTLNAVSAIDLDNVANQVIGNVVIAATTQGSINLNTNITRISATAIQGGISINDIGDLNITAADQVYAAPSGNISIQLTGNLSIAGNVTGDGGGFVTLNSTGGNITTSGNSTFVYADNLAVRAATDSVLNASVNTLTANITGSGQNLTLTNSYDNTQNLVSGANLSIGAANVVLNGGILSLTLDPTVSASLIGNGSIDTAGGNISLTAANGGITLNQSAGQIKGNVLNVTAQNNTDLNTNVATLIANITNNGSTLTINEANNLTAVGTNVATNNGAITINLATGSLNGSGNIVAGTGTVTLNASQGSITLNQSPSQVSGGVLNVTANGSTALETNVSTLIASITGSGSTLTINEASSLTAIGTNVATNNGQISINLATGSLNGVGNIIAGSSGNVILNASQGSITLNQSAGQISGNVLNVTAQNNTALNTNVATLIANITNNGATLTINEANNLTAIGTNVATNNGAITINLATGSLNGVGNIIAGTGTVTLNASQGGITLNQSAGQVSGNVLNVTARNSTALNTNVGTLIASITGNGSTLTVNELNSLTAIGSNVATNNGHISINLATGSLIGSGNIVAGTGNVTLNASQGGITLNQSTSQISGNVLNVTAQNNTDLNTNVGTLIANITNNGSTLTINEANALTAIGTNVATNNGQISINLVAGSLTGSGNIVAGPSGNVILNASQGGITLSTSAGQISGNVLNVTARSNTTLNTSVNTLAATITGVGSTLTVNETNGLLVSGNLSTINAALTVNVAAGNLDVGSNRIGAGAAGNVSLNIANGALLATGLVTGNVLTLRANNTTALNTTVNTLVANITDPAAAFIVTESDSLTIGSGNVRTNNGAINITTGLGGALTRTGTINAGTANVALNVSGGTSGTGLVTGNVLNLASINNATINTTINSLVANVTGTGQALAVYQTGRDLTVDASDVRTSGGSLTLDVASPSNLSVTGNVAAGAGNVVLAATGGNVTTTGQISGNVLTVNAGSTSTLNTAVTALVANITAAGASLNVTEANSLTIGAGNVRTNSGAINITTAAGGSLTRTGNISAGNATVTLNLAGGTSGNGVVSGTALNLTAGGASTVNTAVSSVVANIASGSLAISDADGIAIGSGNVVTNNANIVITAAGGSLNGNGTINAGTGAVRLTNTNGGIALVSVPNQVVASSVAINATATSAVNTKVSTLSANITGPGGPGLTVTQTGLLSLGTVTSSNGTITLNVANGMNGTGPVSAGTAGFVVLNASNGAITLTAANQVTAAGLSVTALNSTAINTNVTTLAANISGSGQTLTINEANGLTTAAGGLVANGGNINVTLAAGSLGGTGAITAGSANVTLNVAAGAISPMGTITGNVLTLRALNSSTLTTNIATLNANVTGAAQSLTVTEANGVAIGTGNVVLNNGSLSITAAAGGINGTGRIAAGSSGSVTLRTPAGNVTLNSTANQITANSLVISALNATAVSTSIGSLNATITGTGSLTVNEANNLTVTQARTANGAINLTTSVNSVVNVTSINAIGTTGNLTMINGNLFIDDPGIRASQQVDLSLTESVTVLGGGIVSGINSVLLPAGQNAVNFRVMNGTDSATITIPGSLRDVIGRINAGGGAYNSTIVVNTPLTVALAAPLPFMTTQMNVQGNGNLTLIGTGAGATASGFTIISTSSNLSTISGVTFRNFGAAGIDLIGARNIAVTNVTVTDSTIGFRASGNLSGSSVNNSTFTNNVIGATLASAQNLVVGVVGQSNRFTGGTGGYRGASTTGMSVSGASGGTVVKANTFTGYPTAVSIVAATNFTFGGTGTNEFNSISNAGTAGIYATGFCTGSSVVKTSFGAGVAASKQYLVSTSRGLTVNP